MDFFEKLGKPVKILGPMVGHSEHAWRALARRYCADICYTEMVHSAVFLRTNSSATNNRWFTTDNEDRPLVVQICGNDPEVMLEAARKLECCCDAIDINLGCPQNIARRGKYGSFLQEEWDTVGEMVSCLSRGLKVPLFCKIRVFGDIDKTVKYARMIESRGCSLLVVHGRTREQKGADTGLASWRHIKAVKDALRIPVIANGNIVCSGDIESCIEFTHCDGIMVSETHLYNPLIFSMHVASPIDIFEEYLGICRALVHSAQPRHVRSHFFKLFHKVFEVLPQLRESVDKCTEIGQYLGLMGEISCELEKLDSWKRTMLSMLHPRIRGKRRPVDELTCN